MTKVKAASAIGVAACGVVGASRKNAPLLVQLRALFQRAGFVVGLGGPRWRSRFYAGLTVKGEGFMYGGRIECRRRADPAGCRGGSAFATTFPVAAPALLRVRCCLDGRIRNEDAIHALSL
jgi:hypothetical protein